MAKEYLGIDAVNDLFDIIDENYVSKEDLENRNKEIAAAICAGSALIAQCLLKLADTVVTVKGAEGGDSYVTTDEETKEMLDEILGGN